MNVGATYTHLNRYKHNVLNLNEDNNRVGLLIPALLNHTDGLLLLQLSEEQDGSHFIGLLSSFRNLPQIKKKRESHQQCLMIVSLDTLTEF